MPEAEGLPLWTCFLFMFLSKHPLLKAQPLITRPFVHSSKPLYYPIYGLTWTRVTIKLLMAIYLSLRNVHLNVFIEYLDIY